MNHDWMLDVLTDLGAYARKHGLMTLARQLDDTRCAASMEISGRSDGPVPDETERSAPLAADHEGEARSVL